MAAAITSALSSYTTLIPMASQVAQWNGSVVHFIKDGVLGYLAQKIWNIVATILTYIGVLKAIPSSALKREERPVAQPPPPPLPAVAPVAAVEQQPQPVVDMSPITIQAKDAPRKNYALMKELNFERPIQTSLSSEAQLFKLIASGFLPDLTGNFKERLSRASSTPLICTLDKEAALIWKNEIVCKENLDDRRTGYHKLSAWSERTKTQVNALLTPPQVTALPAEESKGEITPPQRFCIQNSQIVVKVKIVGGAHQNYQLMYDLLQQALNNNGIPIGIYATTKNEVFAAMPLGFVPNPYSLRSEYEEAIHHLDTPQGKLFCRLTPRAILLWQAIIQANNTQQKNAAYKMLQETTQEWKVDVRKQIDEALQPFYVHKDCVVIKPRYLHSEKLIQRAQNFRQKRNISGQIVYILSQKEAEPEAIQQRLSQLGMKFFSRQGPQSTYFLPDRTSL